MKADQALQTSHLLREATRYLEVNKECYVAQWILQNPDEKINDWVLAHGINDLGEFTFKMERKNDSKT